MARNQPNIVYFHKEVLFRSPRQASFKFKGSRSGVVPKVVSALNAKKLINRGEWAFLTNVVDAKQVEGSMDSVLVVKEFSDVFPDDLLGLPLV